MKRLLLLTIFGMGMGLMGWGQTTLAGWDMSGQTNFGTSPLTATSTGANVTVGQLTKGSGILGGGTAASRAWGGGTSSTWAVSSSTSITNGAYATFTIKANTGYNLSLSAINPFDYRRSSTGPPSGLIQYQINSGSFIEITTVSFSVTTSGGGSIGSTDLSAVSALQNLPSTTTVTIRIVPFGAAPGGTWYIFDKSNTTSVDFAITGTATASTSAPSVTTTDVTSIGTTSATFNGNITSDGGSEITDRGFCYKTTSGVTINDNKTSEGGTTTGTYSKVISTLTAGQQYFYRAYATNDIGTTLSSTEISFYTYYTEPTNHPSSFTATANSQTSITTNWNDNDPEPPGQNASGYLIFASTTNSFTDPVDGTAQTDDNNLADGSGKMNISHGVQTYAWTTGLSAGTLYYFKIYAYNGSGTSINYLTDPTGPTASATTAAALDATSEVDGPVLGSQPNPTVISSLVDTDGEALRVFDMDVYDYGTDGQPTKITQLTIKAGNNNDANWATVIQGVKLSINGGTSFVTTGTPTIGASSIVIPVTSGNLNVPDADGINIWMYIYLNTSGLTDNQILEFKVDAGASAHGFLADATGSTFLATFSSAPVSNQMLIDVDASKLLFTTAPSATACPNTNLSTPPVVTAKDANNNTDTDFTGQVTLTNSGNLVMTGYQITNATDGVATFTNLQFTETGNVTLSTTNTSGLINAGPTDAITISVSNVSGTGATNGNAQSVLSWTNPSCYDEIMIVAKAGSAVGATPTGDGSAYAGDLAFGSGTTIDGGYVVYEGSSSPITVTSLTNGTTYYFTFFTRKGTSWSTGTTATATPEAVTLASDYFRSKASGNWNVTGTWESSADGNSWSNSTLTPTTSANTVTILNGHEVTVSASVSVDQVVISSGGQITVSSGQTLTIANGTGTDMTVNGTLKSSGSLTTTGTLSFGDGGKYQDNHTSNVALPTATWHTNSTFEMIGYTTNTNIPSNTGQTFGNFVWNCTSQSANFPMASFSGDFAVSGSFKVLSTGSGTLRFTGSSAKTLTVNSLIIEGGIFDLTSSSGVGTFILTGDFIMNGGTLTESGSASGVIQMGGSLTQYINYSAGTISNSVNFSINGSDVVLAGNTLVLPNNLTINASKKLTIGSSSALKVTGTLTNSATETGLVIKSDASNTGSLIYTNTGVSGTMERYLSNYTSSANGWHLLSSPINNFTIAGSGFEPGSTSPNLDDLYAWDEVGYQWLNYKVGANNITTFVNGQGYLASYETAATKNFAGTFNNADITFNNLSLTTAKGKGWHLLGNPFQAALLWNDGNWALSNIATGAKIMNSGGSYTDVVNGGLNQYIPANQGFFVNATDATNSITIPKAARVHNSTAFYKDVIPNILTLKASDGEFYVETWVQIMEGATTSFDAAYDVQFYGGVYQAPQLYSESPASDRISTNRIGLVTEPATVPLGFKSFLNRGFTITAENVNSFDNDMDIYLEDVQAGVQINLKEIQSYSFNAIANETTNRFKLHFLKSTGIETAEPLAGLSIYSFGNSLYFNTSLSLDAYVSVFNITGQEVYSTRANLNGQKQFNLNVPTGWYVVKVMCDEGIKSEKIFIR